jgi:enediyne biosynthesis protein E4
MRGIMQRFILCFVLVFNYTLFNFPQTFTKITTGSIVNDTGAWRSVNWGYVNNDLYPDLFVSNGFYTSAHPGGNNALYINNGPPDFTFTKIDSSIVSNNNSPSDGASFGDYNNDGELDLFVVNWYGINNLLYRNDGNGSFSRITNQNLVLNGGHSECCTWGDYDNDGLLDLYVANSGETGAPEANFLYHNKKNGTFERILVGSIVTDKFFTRGATWIDYDNDGDLDLYTCNERNQKNYLYKNMLKETGIASFQAVTGLNIVSNGKSSWSASWGDFNNDGYPDLFLANGWPLLETQNQLYLNIGNGTFTEVINDPIVQDTSAFGCASWGDFDNDGDLDLFVTTSYANAPSKNLMYKNMLMETGIASFTKVTEGDIVNDISNSYGASWVDFNNDGKLDLFVARTLNESDHNLLYRNDIANGNKWVEVSCTGCRSNKSAIGAKVRVSASINGKSTWQMRTVEGESGYCAQNLILHFGLGNAVQIDTMIIEWPSGIKQILQNLPVNQIMKIEEDTTLTVIINHSDIPPFEFKLMQNYPNPFNPSTKINYNLPLDSRVTIDVFNLTGKRIGQLVNKEQSAGYYSVDFNTSIINKSISSGVYFYMITAVNKVNGNIFSSIKKMILLK